MLKVLVCGGRDYKDRERVFAALDLLNRRNGIKTIIHGAAPGADTLAGEWAQKRAVPVMEFPANWKRYGTAAGPRRNEEMLEVGKPEAVVAFPGGAGTADMTRKAEAAGLKVWRPYG